VNDTPRQSRPSKESKKRGLPRRLLGKLFSILREKDPPHKIALGLALGIFVGLLPIMGVQMATVTLIALPLRANLKAANAAVWISNPFTFIPMYYFNYRLGLRFFSGREVAWSEFRQVMIDASNWHWDSIKESFHNLVDMGKDIMIPLWTGSAILAVFFGLCTYVVSYYYVVGYRSRKSVRMAGLRIRARANREARRSKASKMKEDE
jgi:uncharacterized protein